MVADGMRNEMSIARQDYPSCRAASSRPSAVEALDLAVKYMQDKRSGWWLQGLTTDL
jgi:hypothetical protein